MSPTGKSDSFRSCVRACVRLLLLRASERSCACALESVPPPSRPGELKICSGAHLSVSFAGVLRFECLAVYFAGVLREANILPCVCLGFYAVGLKTPAHSNNYSALPLKPQ